MAEPLASGRVRPSGGRRPPRAAPRPSQGQRRAGPGRARGAGRGARGTEIGVKAHSNLLLRRVAAHNQPAAGARLESGAARLNDRRS